MTSSKHHEFWGIAGRNVLRFPGHALTIFIPLFIAMGLASVMTFIKDGMYHDALKSITMLPDITIQQMDSGRIGHINPSLSKQISSYENVQNVSPRIWGHVPVATAKGIVTYTMMGIGPGNFTFGNKLNLKIENGRFLNPADRHCAVVGKIFAQQNNVKIGTEIFLKDTLGNESEFSIIGTFACPASIFSADLILTDLQSAAEFFGYNNSEYSDLGVHLKDPAQAALVSGMILADNKNIRALTKSQLSEMIRQAYASKSGVFQLMWLIILLTVFLLCWAQTSSIGLRMKQEIGLLKALGWQTLDIIELKMFEVLIIGLAGLLTGILFGIIYLYLGAPLLKDYFLGWAAMYPQFPVPIYIEWSSLFLLFVVGVFPLSVATIFPAWLMGTIEPDSAMRSL